MPKVSVIVPVFNTEPYLKRCVNSLINQSLKDIEIILIDDGSPDNSPKICDEFAKQDSRIKVIHKQNGGAGSARNVGIKMATGDFLGYIDSDDYVELDMYEKLYTCAINNNVDFVMADYYRICDNSKTIKTFDIRAGLYTKNDIINEIYPMLIMRENINFGPLLSVCHCLYKTSFIKQNKLYFDEEIKWAEDCIYSAILGYTANSFYYLKGECVYNYIQNNGSVTTTYKPLSWQVYCLMNKKLRNFFKDKTIFDFSRQFDLHIIYFTCSVFTQLKYSNYNFRQKYTAIKEIINTSLLTKTMKNFELPDVGFKFKILLYLIKYRQSLILTIIKRKRPYNYE